MLSPLRSEPKASDFTALYATAWVNSPISWKSQPFRFLCSHALLILGFRTFLVFQYDVRLKGGVFLAEGPRSSGWFHTVLNFMGPDWESGSTMMENKLEVALSKVHKASQRQMEELLLVDSTLNNNFRLGSNQVDELYFFNQP